MKEEFEELLEASEWLLEAIYELDPATVGKPGTRNRFQHAVYNASIAYKRMKRFKKAVKEARKIYEMKDVTETVRFVKSDGTKNIKCDSRVRDSMVFFCKKAPCTWGLKPCMPENCPERGKK